MAAMAFDEKRYEDVVEILDAGIGVLTAVNIQHLETLNDAVSRVTGVRVRETVPDTFLDRADEVVNVDVTVQELQSRLRQGKVYKPEKVEQALSNFFRETNLSTLREPYRIEGKKTLGLELALQLGWRLPDAIIYPTGGGTGLIGMWKAFQELKAAGWVEGELPRMFTVQSAGCAPIVQAFASGADHASAWPDPRTVASGLRVPGPLGDRIMLRILRESNGGAVAVDDDKLTAAARYGSQLEGIDFAPEGGAAIAAAAALRADGVLSAEQAVVIFNTGASWLYR